MNDPKAAPVAVRSAATVMLIDDRPDLQVFMMKRNAGIQFAGGMWVFPGGSVDEGDAADQCQAYCVHRSEAEANDLLGLTRGGLAYYAAAIREAFEEAGVLLALHRESETLLELLENEPRQRFDRLRDELNDGSRSFNSILEEESLILDAGEMHYVARWITPPGPPRRFDTRFFVARAPKAQNPIHDDNELVNSGWLTPAAVLEQAASGEMGMLPPTQRMVEILNEFSSVDEVMASARANLPDERLPMLGRNSPPPAAGADISKAEPGWVRLRRLG